MKQIPIPYSSISALLAFRQWTPCFCLTHRWATSIWPSGAAGAVADDEVIAATVVSQDLAVLARRSGRSCPEALALWCRTMYCQGRSALLG